MQELGLLRVRRRRALTGGSGQDETVAALLDEADRQRRRGVKIQGALRMSSGAPAGCSRTSSRPKACSTSSSGAPVKVTRSGPCLALMRAPFSRCNTTPTGLFR